MSTDGQIDFVVGAGEAPGEDEDLAAPPPRRRWPWALGGLAVVAAAVAAVVAGPDGDRGAAPAASSPPRSGSASVYQPPPPVAVPGSVVRIPEGNRPSPRPAGCPDDAQCYVDDHDLPAAALTELRHDVTGARLVSTHSLLANRAGRFGPDLVTRSVHLRAGPVEVTVTVRKPRRADRDGYTEYLSGPRVRRTVTVTGPSFTVTVTATGVAGLPDRAALARVAHASGTVAPQ